MNGATAQVIDRALRAAVRAPSPCNTQPWLFQVHGHRIELSLDRSRVLPVADPDADEALLACGAALCNLRISLRAQDRVSLVDLQPDPQRPDLLAAVRVGGNRAATSTEYKLAEAIAKRHTNRRPFLDRAVPTPARHALATAARTEGATLSYIDASARYSTIARLVRRADQVQQSTPEYAEEIARWTAGGARRDDGVPDSAVGPPPDRERLLALRDYHRSAEFPSRTYEQQPLVAAVLTTVPGRRSTIRAGAGMQRALLTASQLGLSASFLSQPFEVPETRTELGALFEQEGVIHTLLRIGYGYPVTATPRRPVSDVIVPG
ncbi:Acg family FMN-binding oxidoreductase [Haloechinothrix sp. LS1_15]|uniref:Acg family FMN-binding oxidoreductase n=1 Tax=Haloechinothrix sp. LS1_15 TaxID=2652248 RepID=UPI0029467E11|nr:hypothetical protein [Haloechinothrix sp. LS1_15]MDV6014219.1 hypothetical protein [Haloechinothrix sp. LS1_15]